MNLFNKTFGRGKDLYTYDPRLLVFDIFDKLMTKTFLNSTDTLIINENINQLANRKLPNGRNRSKDEIEKLRIILSKFKSELKKHEFIDVQTIISGSQGEDNYKFLDYYNFYRYKVFYKIVFEKDEFKIEVINPELFDILVI